MKSTTIIAIVATAAVPILSAVAIRALSKESDRPIFHTTTYDVTGIEKRRAVAADSTVTLIVKPYYWNARVTVRGIDGDSVIISGDKNWIEHLGISKTGDTIEVKYHNGDANTSITDDLAEGFTVSVPRDRLRRISCQRKLVLDSIDCNNLVITD